MGVVLIYVFRWLSLSILPNLFSLVWGKLCKCCYLYECMTWTLKLLVTNRSIRMLSQPCPRLVLGMLIRRKLEDAEKGACYSVGLPNFASNTLIRCTKGNTLLSQPNPQLIPVMLIRCKLEQSAFIVHACCLSTYKQQIQQGTKARIDKNRLKPVSFISFQNKSVFHVFQNKKFIGEF